MLDDRHVVATPLALAEAAMRRLLGDGAVAALACRHLDGGGGRVRARLALETAHRLHIASETAVALAAASELLHNASLVHDDIADRDAERRGRPALWALAGVGPALCAGDLMISAAYAALADLTGGAPVGQAIAMLHEAVATTILGQARDLAAVADAPFDQAMAIAAAKSAPLIALPVRLALLAAQAPGDVHAREAAAALSVGYQIADDLVDLPGDRAAGRLNVVTALERAGGQATAARATAIDHARQSLRHADRAARSIPHDAGLSLADLADRIQRQLTEIENAP